MQSVLQDLWPLEFSQSAYSELSFLFAQPLLATDFSRSGLPIQFVGARAISFAKMPVYAGLSACLRFHLLGKCNHRRPNGTAIGQADYPRQNLAADEQVSDLLTEQE
jgi:hypothetical protein